MKNNLKIDNAVLPIISFSAFMLSLTLILICLYLWQNDPLSILIKSHLESAFVNSNFNH